MAGLWILPFSSQRSFGFQPKEHDALGEALGQMDFEAAARVSGSRFTVLERGLAPLPFGR